MVLQHMRIARPVSNLTKSCEMYSNGLGLKTIGNFTDHDGFSGYMLGLDSLSWHLEFTLSHEHPVLPSPSNEDLLVLYIPEKKVGEPPVKTWIMLASSEFNHSMTTGIAMALPLRIWMDTGLLSNICTGLSGKAQVACRAIMFNAQKL